MPKYMVVGNSTTMGIQYVALLIVHVSMVSIKRVHVLARIMCNVLIVTLVILDRTKTLRAHQLATVSAYLVELGNIRQVLEAPHARIVPYGLIDIRQLLEAPRARIVPRVVLECTQALHAHPLPIEFAQLVEVENICQLLEAPGIIRV
jgi:hypothetical protein